MAQRITQEDIDFAKRVYDVLITDPSADDHIIQYKETFDYLLELIEKDESLLNGFIIAMETYLKK